VKDCSPRIVATLGLSSFCPSGYARDVPFGCVDQGLLSVIYFLPGQAMAPHRHLDSDEYFTVLVGDADMIVNGERVCLPQGHTFLRFRGTLHAIRNSGGGPLVVQSFQTPLPTDEATIWECVPWWMTRDIGSCCVRCWCGQMEDAHCLNCGAPWRTHAPGWIERRAGNG
jgi:mannose-6-phosphate isomerase-like protein (cupin superfamily)